MKPHSFELLEVVNLMECNASVNYSLKVEAILAEVFDGSDFGYREEWDGSLEYFCPEERKCIEYWMRELRVSLRDVFAEK